MASMRRTPMRLRRTSSSSTRRTRTSWARRCSTAWSKGTAGRSASGEETSTRSAPGCARPRAGRSGHQRRHAVPSERQERRPGRHGTAGRRDRRRRGLHLRAPAVSAGSLHGKRVLIARAEGQADGPARLLRVRGAEPVVIASIVIGPPEDAGPLRAAVAELDSFDWVVLTSANGVAALQSEMARAGRGRRTRASRWSDRRRPTRCEPPGSPQRSCCQGGAFYRGLALATELVGVLGSGTSPRVLVVRAQEAPDVLPDALTEAGGAQVTVVAVLIERAPRRSGTAEIAQKAARDEPRRGHLLPHEQHRRTPSARRWGATPWSSFPGLWSPASAPSRFAAATAARPPRRRHPRGLDVPRRHRGGRARARAVVVIEAAPAPIPRGI